MTKKITNSGTGRIKAYIKNKTLFQKHSCELGTLSMEENVTDIVHFKARINSVIEDIHKEGDLDLIKEVYDKINISNLSEIQLNPSIDFYKKEILKILEKQYDNNNLPYIKSFCYFLKNVGKKSIPVDDIDIIGPNFTLLGNFSRRKVLVNYLLKKFPSRVFNKSISKSKSIENKIKRLERIENAKKISLIDSAFSELSMKFDNNMNIMVDEKIGDTFSSKNIISLDDLKKTFMFFNVEERNAYIEILRNAKIPSDVINDFLDHEKQFDNVIDSNKSSKIDGVKANNLIDFVEVDRRKIVDFNPSILDLSLASGLKIFSFDRFKDIYKNTFYNIASDILDKNDGIKPGLNGIFKVDSYELLTSEEKKKIEKKKGDILYQYHIEWDVEDGISESELRDLAKLIDSEYGDINLKTTLKYQRFNHPIKTGDKVFEYKGFFDESESKFEGDYIIELKESNTEESKRKIRLCLNNYVQDDYIYFISQIGYYLKHKKFIDKKQLFSNIYYKYTEVLLEGEKIFDISFMKEKYGRIMEDIIIPLSKEGRDLGLKAENTILTGPYGTSKSQFLLNLLKNRSFEYNGKIFNFNANVLTIDVSTFEGLLLNDIGGLRTKLSEMYEKTGLPILLIVEDFETILNEKRHDVNDKVAQKLTTVLEGVGSLPITIIASTNNPEHIPERLLRPNRFSNIIPFFLPEENEKKIILETHLNNYKINLDNDIKSTFINNRVMTEGTASHIAEFVSKLNKKIKTHKDIFGTNFELNETNILKIADSINISSDDIKSIIDSQEKWLKSIRGNSNNSIGFRSEAK